MVGPSYELATTVMTWVAEPVLRLSGSELPRTGPGDAEDPLAELVGWAVGVPGGLGVPDAVVPEGGVGAVTVRAIAVLGVVLGKAGTVTKRPPT